MSNLLLALAFAATLLYGYRTALLLDQFLNRVDRTRRQAERTTLTRGMNPCYNNDRQPARSAVGRVAAPR